MSGEIRAIDAAYPPTLPQLLRAKADGIRLIFSYLGQRPGSGLYHEWTKADISAVEAEGIPTADIWFPPQGLNVADPAAGREAVSTAQAKGVRPGHIIAIDIEAGTRGPAVVAEVSQFSADVRAAGYRSCAYGLSSFVLSLVAGAVDLTWRAVYGARPAALSPRDGVQWWNSHDAYGGWGVDESLLGSAWLDAVLNPQQPVLGGTFTMADLDQNLVNRGLIAFLLELLEDRTVTGADLDWFVAHAHDVGAGQAEWAIEGLLGGNDSAEPPAASAAFRRLQALGAGRLPTEIMAAIMAKVPAPPPDEAAAVATLQGEVANLEADVNPPQHQGGPS